MNHHLEQTGRVRLRRQRGGFTLTEVIFVCVLMGLFMAIAVPRIDFQRVRVDSAALQVASQLLLAQRIAVMNQYDVRVSFDSVKSTLIVHQDKNGNGTVESGELTRTEPLGEGAQYSHKGAVLYGAGPALTFEKDAVGRPTVVFHRNGSASEEGAVHISNLPLGGAQADRAVRVTRATGLARCWNRRQGSAWQEGC